MSETINHLEYINNQPLVTVDSEIINLHTGMMMYREPVCSTTGNETPYSVELYYRGNGFGVGANHQWYSNFDQSVELVTDGTALAAYTDSTGKKHYFTLGTDGELHDTEGLEMKLVFNGGGSTDAGTDALNATLYEKNGREIHFDEYGIIEMIIEPDNGKINVALTSDAREIWDSNFHPSKITYYNNSVISKITDEAGREVTAQFTGSKITKLSYPDGTSTNFAYNDNGNISQVTKRDGVRVVYEYEGNKVTSVKKFASDNNTSTPDEYTNIEYRGSRNRDACATVVKDRTGINRVYVFDTYGRNTLMYEEKTDGTNVDHKNVTGTVMYAYTDKKRTFSAAISLDDEEHNLVENGSFESGLDYWEADATGSIVDTESVNGEKMFKISAGGGELTQSVSVSATDMKYGDTMILSAWTKKLSLNDSFKLKISGSYSDGTNISTKSVDFFSEYNDWQYAAIPLELAKNKLPATLTVAVEMNGTAADGYVDNVRFTNALATSKQIKKATDPGVLDEEMANETIFGKNVAISEWVITSDGIYTTKDFNDARGNTVKRIISDMDGNSFTSVYEYDEASKLLYSQDYKNVITAYTYTGSLVSGTRTFCYSEFNPTLTDEIINGSAAVITAQAYAGTGEEHPTYTDDERSADIWSVRSYGEYCKYVLEDQESVGWRGLVKTYVTPNKLSTSYTYDTAKDDALTRISASENNKNYVVDFGYDSVRRLNKITRNGFDYDFTYDGMGRMKTVSVAGAQYCDNTYDTSSATTTVTTTYAGGEKLKVVTDKHQNPVKKSYIDANGVETVLAEAEYDSLGKVTKYIDKTEEKEYTYTYNELGKVDKVYLDGRLFKSHNYDSHGRDISPSIYPEEDYWQHFTYGYEHRDNSNGTEAIYPSNQLESTEVYGRSKIALQKDNIGRPSVKTLVGYAYTMILGDRYTYLDTAERLTNYVSKLEHLTNYNTTVEKTFDYTYDDDGNITEIKVNGVTTFTYTYDKLGQLTRENNRLLNVTYTFAYDVGGNITSRTKYAYTTGTLGTAISTDTYTYDTVNKDRLVSYNGQAITYDVKGNPTTYKGNALTWGRVRLLSSYGNNTYAYNADGIRVRKNNTYYTLDGSNIMHEYDNSGKNIYYYYGVDGLYGFRIGETDYFYKKNLQGDITDIYHEDGTKYASYEYDAWGNCTITLDTNGIGTLNPFRYRGYYYDSETGLYYLKSRYYDPAVGRFVNADELSVLEVEQDDFLQYNLYAYCLNNPINMTDSHGFLAGELAIGWTVGASNAWNPVGWVILGAIVVVATVSFSVYYYKEHTTTKNGKKKEKHQNGNARRQRDQGGEKKKQKSGWKRPR